MTSEVPHGWQMQAVKDIAADHRATWKPDPDDDTLVQHFSIPAFDDGRRPSIEPGSAIKSNKRVVPQGATLVSRLNPATPRVWKPRPTAGSLPVCSSEMSVLTPRDGVDEHFLYYALQSPLVGDGMTARATGTTGSRQRIKPADFLSLSVLVPPYEEQRAIAEVLSALDDRIDCCLGLISRSWDAADAIWAGSLVADEPRWSSVGDEVIFHNRVRKPLSAAERAEMPGPFPYYGATGVFDHLSKFLFDGEYVLVGEDGSVQRPDGSPIVQYVWGQFWVNNHAHVMTGHGLRPHELALALGRANVSGFVTGAAQPKLSMGRLKQVSLLLPAEHALDRIRPALGCLFQCHREATSEVATLEGLREALLPRLMSGGLRIKNLTDVLEGAA